MLQLNCSKEGQELLKALGINEKTNLQLMNARMMLNAQAGSEKAYELVRDTVGEKPITQSNIDITQDININVTLIDPTQLDQDEPDYLLEESYIEEQEHLQQTLDNITNE
jgi:hypothetical protein